jgi:excisionase family DNA binding protein
VARSEVNLKEGNMDNQNNLTVEEASRLMGVSRQFIRVGLQKGVLPFGYAVKISDGRFTYFISRQKFLEHTGIKGEEKCSI